MSFVSQLRFVARRTRIADRERKKVDKENFTPCGFFFVRKRRRNSRVFFFALFFGYLVFFRVSRFFGLLNFHSWVFLAFAVVSFENGFKSPYFSSFFFSLCDFSCFLLFLCCFFFRRRFVEILDFLFFVFWLSRSFRLKMASNPLIFHRFFFVLRFFLFSAIFVLFFFRRRFVEILDFLFFVCLAFAVVSFENGFKSPYFSSVFFSFCDFSCFLPFLCSRFFGVASLKFWIFLFFVFWLSRSFRLKMASNPLIFPSFFFRFAIFFVFCHFCVVFFSASLR